MIGRLNHVAIAVKDVAVASSRYREALGAKVSAPLALPEHGVTVVFVELPNTKIELIEPLGDAVSDREVHRPNTQTGAIHHLCFEVDDIVAACERLTRTGTRDSGDMARQRSGRMANQSFSWTRRIAPEP